MAERVFVHVGAPKAGTTYLQTVLWANQAPLAEVGVLLPGEVKFDHNRVAQAVRSDHPNKAARNTWARVQREIHDWSGDALISNEWFTMANRERAEQMVDRLRPSEVHIVFTARNLLSAVPSAWQQPAKVGLGQPLGSFLTALESDDPDDRWTWSNLDPALALTRWARAVPPERVHVVTVPPGGSEPDLLWKRFASACGFDPDCCDLGQHDKNESLGVESAQLLQLAGPSLRDAVDAESEHWRVPDHWIRTFIADKTLVPLGGSKVALSEEEIRIIQERSEHSVLALTDAGYDVVGDLDELTRRSLPSEAIRPEDVSAEAMLDRATETMGALLRRARREKVRADRYAERVAELEARLAQQDPSVSQSTTRKDVRSRLRPLVRRIRDRFTPS